MSYQRASEGRFYVWMGTDGLHVSHDPVKLSTAKFEHGPHGKANAKAVLRGLIDFLAAEGVSVKINKTGASFGKIPRTK